LEDELISLFKAYEKIIALKAVHKLESDATLKTQIEEKIVSIAEKDPDNEEIKKDKYKQFRK
jgi:hypothetical protein